MSWDTMDDDTINECETLFGIVLQPYWINCLCLIGFFMASFSWNMIKSIIRVKCLKKKGYGMEQTTEEGLPIDSYGMERQDSQEEQRRKEAQLLEKKPSLYQLILFLDSEPEDEEMYFDFDDYMIVPETNYNSYSQTPRRKTTDIPEQQQQQQQQPNSPPSRKKTASNQTSNTNNNLNVPFLGDDASSRQSISTISTPSRIKSDKPPQQTKRTSSKVLLKEVIVPSNSFMIFQSFVQWIHIIYILISVSKNNYGGIDDYLDYSLRIINSGSLQLAMSWLLWLTEKKNTFGSPRKNGFILLSINFAYVVTTILAIVGALLYFYVALVALLVIFVGFWSLAKIKNTVLKQKETQPASILLTDNKSKYTRMLSETEDSDSKRSSFSQEQSVSRIDIEDEKISHQPSIAPLPPAPDVTVPKKKNITKSFCKFFSRVLLALLPKLFISFGFILFGQTLCHYAILYLSQIYKVEYLHVFTQEYNMRNTTCYMNALYDLSSTEFYSLLSYI